MKNFVALGTLFFFLLGVVLFIPILQADTKSPLAGKLLTDKKDKKDKDKKEADKKEEDKKDKDKKDKDKKEGDKKEDKKDTKKDKKKKKPKSPTPLVGPAGPA